MGKEKSKKRRRSSSSSDSERNSDLSREKKRMKKLKKKLKKEQKRAKKLLKKKLKLENKTLKSKHPSGSNSPDMHEKLNQLEPSPSDVPLELMEKSKAMAPMTKEEWEKKQSVIRKVLDEETGRYRLIKGDGEVLEEIVTRDRHKEINRQATRADGNFFQSQTNRGEKL